MKNIVYLGGKQVGCAGLLSVIAIGYDVKAVVPYGYLVENLAAELEIPMFQSVKGDDIHDLISGIDMIVSVHSREIVPKEVLDLPRYGSINVHPCLSRYKGANPVHRFFDDGWKMASVGVHYMTEVVDEGDVIIEEYVNVTGAKSVNEIYNILYPYYITALIRALKRVERDNNE